MKYYVSFLISFFTATANANIYLVQAIDTDKDYFQAKLSSRNSQIAFADYQFQIEKQKAESAQIEKLFLQSRNKNQHTLSLLNQIYRQRFDFEWNQIQRKIIAETIHVLADLEVDPIRKQRLLLEKTGFLTPLKSGNKSFRLKDLLPQVILNNYQYASLNGMKLSFDKTVFTNGESFRLGLFSNQRQYESHLVSPETLSSLQLPGQALAVGGCHTGFHLNTQMLDEAKIKIIANECEQLVNDKTNSAPKAQTSPDITNSFTASKRPKFKSKWLVWGAVILGAISLMNQKDQKTPTKTSGF